ncbi:putative deoxycytidylate deaminase-like isoform X2 [Capsicum annuum]|nr:putative deoxycytidylate deaminase-like isoform X2 [Capsicum annuum]
MNSRELTLVSAAAVIGAFASAMTIRFFFNPKRPSVTDSDSSGVDRSQQRKSSSKNPFDPSKRLGYLSWDDYFMAIAFLSAQRSKDPNRQPGIGYNGFPRGCSDDKLPWAKKSKNGNPLETKYPYVCHAEVNAILNTNHASAEGQSGVSEVIYFVEKRLDGSDTAYVASHKLLSMAGIKVRKHQPQMKEISIKFEEL